MFVRLFLLFTLVPLADLVLLLMISKSIPVWATVTIIVVTGLLGAWLAKRQWNGVKSRIQTRLQANQMPTELITDGMLVLLAGGLLVAPGLITDALGISLLIPLCRNWYKKRTIEYLKERFNVTTFTAPVGASRTDEDIVEGGLADDADDAENFSNGENGRDSQSATLPHTIESTSRTDLPTDSTDL